MRSVCDKRAAARERPPVAFAKLRLQEADAVPRAGIFLLQPVKSIDHYDREVDQNEHRSKQSHQRNVI